MNFIEEVRHAAKRRTLFLPHAILQMSHPERMITTGEVEKVIKKGKIVEDYPNDSRGHSCLILGFGMNGRPIHVVCAPKESFLAIITAYLPTEDEWENDYSKRRQK